MRGFLFGVFLLPPLLVHANEARFLGENAVMPDPVQRELIASSIEALVQDCSSAVKVESLPESSNPGVEAIFSTRAIEFNHPSAGKVTGVTKVVVRLWDNAENNYGMDIYAFSGPNIYLLGKYSRLAYPIVNMIIRPMPPNQLLQKDARKAGASE